MGNTLSAAAGLSWPSTDDVGDLSGSWSGFVRGRVVTSLRRGLCARGDEGGRGLGEGGRDESEAEGASSLMSVSLRRCSRAEDMADRGPER
jgi:hypothetical protein